MSSRGVAFIKSVVRAQGGVVAVSNRPEGGAQLSIGLPLAMHAEFALPPVVLADEIRCSAI
jgi:sensor histidine kinase regulating citrate/malate metabolism